MNIFVIEYLNVFGSINYIEKYNMILYIDVK